MSKQYAMISRVGFNSLRPVYRVVMTFDKDGFPYRYTSTQARMVAQQLINAADEIDRWKAAKKGGRS